MIGFDTARCAAAGASLDLGKIAKDIWNAYDTFGDPIASGDAMKVIGAGYMAVAESNQGSDEIDVRIRSKGRLADVFRVEDVLAIENDVLQFDWGDTPTILAIDALETCFWSSTLDRPKGSLGKSGLDGKEEEIRHTSYYSPVY